MEIYQYPALVFTVCDGVKPVGMATLTQQGEVRDFLVEEGYRGKGYGKSLIENVVKYIVEHFDKEAAIFFYTGSENEMIAKFAEHYGCKGSLRYFIRVKDYLALKGGA